MIFNEKFERLWTRIIAMVPRMFKGKLEQRKEEIRKIVKDEFDV